MKVEEKIALDAIKNDRESHIKLDQEKCEACKERLCIALCPGHLYSLNADTGEMVVEYAGCLECGTCMIACACGAVTWTYPKGECGVQYRYG
jgi:ferredoxin like protein